MTEMVSSQQGKYPPVILVETIGSMEFQCPATLQWFFDVQDLPTHDRFGLLGNVPDSILVACRALQVDPHGSV